MKLTILSPQQWAETEHWINFTLPGWVIGLLVAAVICIIPITMKKNKLTLAVFLAYLAVAVGFGIYASQRNQTAIYHEYVKESHYTSAQTRSYNAVMFAYTPNSPSDIAAMRYLAEIKLPSKLRSVYTKTFKQTPVKLVGKSQYYVYIAYRGKVMKFYDSLVHLTNANSSYMTGYKFTMRNAGFKKLGFLELPYILRDQLYIPHKQYNDPNKVIRNELDYKYERPGEVGGWVVDLEK